MADRGAATRRGGRPRAVHRREEILAAAARLLRRQGFAATTLAQIAREVGVVQSALYRHFPGKTEILAEITVRSQQRLEESLAEAASRAGGPRAAFQQVVLDAMRQLRVEGDVAAWLREAWPSLGRGIRKRLLARMARPADGWAQLVAAANPRLDARLATALVTAVGQVIASSNPSIDPQWYVEIILAMLDGGAGAVPGTRAAEGATAHPPTPSRTSQGADPQAPPTRSATRSRHGTDRAPTGATTDANSVPVTSSRPVSRSSASGPRRTP